MSRKRKDYSGRIFGKLVVLGTDVEKSTKGRTWLICKCNCEKQTIKSIRLTSLLSGNTTSCGCKYKDVGKTKIKDLKGMVFGKLTVIEFAYTRKNGAYWLCRCSCDNQTLKIISSKNLLCGSTISCGCYLKEKLHDMNKKYNTYDLSGEYGIGWTSNTNKEFYFDLEDYNKIKDYYWRENIDGYIYSSVNNKKNIIHRIIMDAKESEFVDHISHEITDNRKINLRLTTNAENMANHQLYETNKSGVSGVYWKERDNIWEVKIGVNGKSIYLGSFNDFNKAVKIRKEAEEKYHKEYSYDNSMKYSTDYKIN